MNIFLKLRGYSKIIKTLSAVIIFSAVSFLKVEATHADPKAFLYQQYLINQAKEHIQYLGHTQHAKINKIYAAGDLPQENISAEVYQQKLDHDSSSDARVFSQRFWVSSQFAKTTAAPVLLFICGEGACGDYAFQTAMSEHAEKLGAYMVAVEHRYYGQSQPFADLKTANLKYLSVHQALLDLIHLRLHIMKEFKLTGDWIAIGGSYAGTLAAYLKSQFPEEFVGALASSAPVRAELDFSAYDLHVASQVGDKCLTAIQDVVREIEEMIKEDMGFQYAKDDFNADAMTNKDDFLYLVADTAATAVQYGMKDTFCKMVIEEGRQGYARGASIVARLFGSLENYSVEAAEDISLAKHGGGVGVRQWFYQSCTEFGFWQNANSNSKMSARSSHINAAYHTRACERMFGIRTPAKVAETNKNFYQPLFNASTSKILFTNGSEDPWQKLSITEDNKNNTNPLLSTFMIQNQAHCDDFGRSLAPEVVEAKARFVNLATEWLK
jgi:pimeloyl-ACP methyl ester carboxylesterase